MNIREQAVGLWLSMLEPNDRILITGARGWFGRTALSMTESFGSTVLATGSQDSILDLRGVKYRIESQDLENISSFEPTVVIDTAFVTRERLPKMGHRKYVETNSRLILDSLAIARLPSVRKYLGFSSGATVHLAGQDSFSLRDNPYAAQKRDYEKRMSDLDVPGDRDISIARVWSVSGVYNTKPDSFAISNLINQAQSGLITLTARNPVFRRYCAVEDVLAITMCGRSGPTQRVFDTGGDLVEIGELAEVVKLAVSSTVEIERVFDPTLEPDSYHSDGKEWEALVQKVGLGSDSIVDQVKRMAEFGN